MWSKFYFISCFFFLMLCSSLWFLIFPRDQLSHVSSLVTNIFQVINHVSSFPWFTRLRISHASISYLPSEVVYAGQIHMPEDMLFDSEGHT